MNESVCPTLLSAAKAFIRKSAGVASVVIAPLAAVSVVSESKAQAILGLATSGSHYFSNSGSGHPSGTFFSSALTPLNDITGVKFGYAHYVLNNFANTSGQYVVLTFSGTGGSGTMPVFSSIPITFNFAVSTSPGVTITCWDLSVRIYRDDDEYRDITIPGTAGIYSGSDELVMGEGAFGPLSSATTFYVEMKLDFDSTTTLGSITVSMDEGSGQGIFLNATAIPEPSTYAIWCGAGVMGLVLVRRRRKALAA